MSKNVMKAHDDLSSETYEYLADQAVIFNEKQPRLFRSLMVDFAVSMGGLDLEEYEV